MDVERLLWSDMYRTVFWEFNTIDRFPLGDALESEWDGSCDRQEDSKSSARFRVSATAHCRLRIVGPTIYNRDNPPALTPPHLRITLGCRINSTTFQMKACS